MRLICSKNESDLTQVEVMNNLSSLYQCEISYKKIMFVFCFIFRREDPTVFSSNNSAYQSQCNWSVFLIKFQDWLTVARFYAQPKSVGRCRCLEQIKWWRPLSVTSILVLFSQQPIYRNIFLDDVCIWRTLSFSSWKSFYGWNSVNSEWKPDLVAKSESFPTGLSRSGISLLVPAVINSLTYHKWVICCF